MVSIQINDAIIQKSKIPKCVAIDPNLNPCDELVNMSVLGGMFSVIMIIFFLELDRQFRRKKRSSREVK